MTTERAMSKREFMRQTGMSFPTVQKLWNDPSFPVTAEKVFWSDFVIWRRRFLRCRSQNTAPHPSPDDGHKACESIPTNGLLAALPPRAERLRALVA